MIKTILESVNSYRVNKCSICKKPLNDPNEYTCEEIDCKIRYSKLVNEVIRDRMN